MKVTIKFLGKIKNKMNKKPAVKVEVYLQKKQQAFYKQILKKPDFFKVFKVCFKVYQSALSIFRLELAEFFSSDREY